MIQPDKSLLRLLDRLQKLSSADFDAVMKKMSDEDRAVIGDLLANQKEEPLPAPPPPSDPNDMRHLLKAGLSPWLVDIVKSSQREGTGQGPITPHSRDRLQEIVKEAFPLPATTDAKPSLPDRLGAFLQRQSRLKT